LLNINPEIQRIGYRTIDVWWDPSQKNGSFMLVLGHLLASSKYWGEPRLHIKTVVLKEKLEQTRALLQELVIQSRIQAEITVLHPDSDQEVRLGMEFERVQKMRRRRSRWLAPFHRMFNSQDADSERPEIPGGEKSEKEKVQNEINPVDSGDEVLKEKLSDQIQEKDDFIINQHINDIIAENSKHADLVMLGFNLPPRGKEKKYIEKMETFLNKLPDTLLVNCPFDFELFN